MLNDIPVLDMLLPGILLVFFLSLLLQLMLDWMLGNAGFYRHVWHPPLFRLAAFLCLFSLLSFLFTLA